MKERKTQRGVLDDSLGPMPIEARLVACSGPADQRPIKGQHHARSGCGGAEIGETVADLEPQVRASASASYDIERRPIRPFPDPSAARQRDEISNPSHVEEVDMARWVVRPLGSQNVFPQQPVDRSEQAVLKRDLQDDMTANSERLAKDCRRVGYMFEDMGEDTEIESVLGEAGVGRVREVYAREARKSNVGPNVLDGARARFEGIELPREIELRETLDDTTRAGSHLEHGLRPKATRQGEDVIALRDRAPCPPFEEFVGDAGVELVVESALGPPAKVFVNDDERLRVHHPTSEGGPRPTGLTRSCRIGCHSSSSGPRSDGRPRPRAAPSWPGSLSR